MALLACKSETMDVLAEALLAAELDHPYDTARLPPEALRELFEAIAVLRAIVPFATLRLLGRLAGDGRLEVRARVAEALGRFAADYPDPVAPLLARLACDTSRRVRAAAAESIAELLPDADDPWQLIDSAPPARPHG